MKATAWPHKGNSSVESLVSIVINASPIPEPDTSLLMVSDCWWASDIEDGGLRPDTKALQRLGGGGAASV